MAQSVEYTPLYSHRFVLDISNGEKWNNQFFYSIKGLGMPAAQSTEAYSPGGYDKTYHLPSTAKEGTLVLRRPAEPLGATGFIQWCQDSLRDQTFDTRWANILCLTTDTTSASGGIVANWVLDGLYPKGLDYSTLGKGIEYGSTGRGEEAYGILEEIVTLGYNHIERRL